MKVTIFNTGHDTDDLKSGEEKVVDREVAEALATKWGGMIKVLPYEEPKTAKVVKKESILKKTIKKLKK